MQISRKWFELEIWYQLTNRKWPMADRMMTYASMMSHDLERSRSWSQYL